MSSSKIMTPPHPNTARRRRLHRRSASSPPSATFVLHCPENYPNIPTPSLEDSVKLLTLNTRRRLLKRQSSSAVAAKPRTEVTPVRREKYVRKEALPEDSDLHAELTRPHFRTPSFPKRHSSFGSPPEVPLPCSLSQSIRPFNTASCASPPLFSKSSGVDPSTLSPIPGEYLVYEYGDYEPSESSGSLPSTSSRDFSPPTSFENSSMGTTERIMRSKRPSFGSGSFSELAGYTIPQKQRPRLSEQVTPSQLAPSQTVFPFSRPYSLPSGLTTSPGLTNPNRTSSASLPLPGQIPYSTLPKIPGLGLEEEGKEKHEPDAASESVTSCQQGYPFPQLSNAFTSNHTYPPPEPPTILTPPLPVHEENERPQAAYEPFLNHAPPPDGSWIAVETSHEEYLLIARLPGFKRDAITLATRRRRILHVVADSWEPAGGHFERRISFGYDADLTQVRAEFDGEYLKIFVPRRLPPANIWSSHQ